jgi:hypothetical protein
LGLLLLEVHDINFYFAAKIEHGNFKDHVSVTKLFAINYGITTIGVYAQLWPKKKKKTII